MPRLGRWVFLVCHLGGDNLLHGTDSLVVKLLKYQKASTHAFLVNRHVLEFIFLDILDFYTVTWLISLLFFFS